MVAARFTRFLSAHDFAGSALERRCHDELSIIAGRDTAGAADAATATLRVGAELPYHREDRAPLVA